jgi:hypothetical protein
MYVESCCGISLTITIGWLKPFCPSISMLKLGMLVDVCALSTNLVTQFKQLCLHVGASIWRLTWFDVKQAISATSDEQTRQDNKMLSAQIRDGVLFQ